MLARLIDCATPLSQVRMLGARREVGSQPHREPGLGLRPGVCRAGLVSFEARLGPRRDSAMTMRTYESLPTAAARIGVSVKTIRRRIAEGVLPVYRCGRILRLDPDDVDAMFSRYPQWTGPEFSSTGRRPTRRAS